jgi:hypothetical protein
MASAKATLILENWGDGEQQTRDLLATSVALKLFASLGTDASAKPNVVDAVLEDIGLIVNTPEQRANNEDGFTMQRLTVTLDQHRKFFPYA